MFMDRKALMYRLSIILLGMLLSMNVVIMPAAAQTTFGDAVCSINGFGKLVSIILTALGVVLVYLGVFDVYKGLKQKKSKSAGKRAQQGSYYESAGKKIVGGAALPGVPTVLSEMGFSLLHCVNATSIFGMVTPVSVSPLTIVQFLQLDPVFQIIILWW